MLDCELDPGDSTSVVVSFYSRLLIPTHNHLHYEDKQYFLFNLNEIYLRYILYVFPDKVWKKEDNGCWRFVRLSIKLPDFSHHLILQYLVLPDLLRLFLN